MPEARGSLIPSQRLAKFCLHQKQKKSRKLSHFTRRRLYCRKNLHMAKASSNTYLFACFKPHTHNPKRAKVGNGPNTVSESTVSNTELGEFFGPHRALGRELSEFLSAYYVCVCAKANSPSFSQNSPSLLQNSVSSLFRNSTLETVFRPFPIKRANSNNSCSVYFFFVLPASRVPKMFA